MSNIVKTFAELINEGNKAAKMITEPDKRAMAYAALAQAIAETGAVNFNDLNTEATEEKAKKEDIKAGSDKGTKAKSKAKSKTKEEKVEKVEMTDIIAESKESEIPVEDTTEEMPAIDEAVETAVAEESEETEAIEESDGDEWTDELQEKYAEEISFLNEVAEAYGEDEVYGRILLEWSQNQFSGIENVTPSNVQAFAYYVQSLVDAAEEE